MNKCIALSTTILAATFTFAPIAGAQQSANETGQQRQEQRGQQAGEGDHQQRNPDQHFIKEAAADNQFEIQTSQYVAQQAQDPQVKQLAERLVQDHRRSQQQLQQIAQQLNMKLPDEFEQWQQAKLQAMQQKHGQHLEMHFAFGQVGDHMTDILKYQYQAEHAQNPQLKQFAEQTIPILQEHLQMAQRAASQWVPQARTAGERIRGNAERNTPGADNSGTGTNQQGTPNGGSNQGGNR